MTEQTQMTIQELLNTLVPIAKNQDKIIEKYGHEAYVEFDFASLYPIGFSSWRGAYDELAIKFSGKEYGDSSNYKQLTINEFISALKDCIGKTFTGWKGGEFVMSEDNRLWVANPGTVGSTGVSGVVDNEYSIILTTDTFEY